MTKPLYDSNDRYSLEANRFDVETHNPVKDIFKKYLTKGYSVRQISQIMQATIVDLELSSMLGNKDLVKKP